MKETKGNILSPEILNQADAICFTSNGILKKDDRLVMGAGVAKAFRDRFDGLDWDAAQSVKKNGNICQLVIGIQDVKNSMKYHNIVAFPTKHHWRNPSDLELIKKSARELMDLVDKNCWTKVYLPRPGCSNGKLLWPKVKSELESILDDRIIIITL
jgi:hypothetical protein